MTRDDQDWLAKQQADNPPPSRVDSALVLAVLGFLALFWCAACAWTIRLVGVLNG